MTSSEWFNNPEFWAQLLLESVPDVSESTQAAMLGTTFVSTPDHGSGLVESVVEDLGTGDDDATDGTPSWVVDDTEDEHGRGGDGFDRELEDDDADTRDAGGNDDHADDDHAHDDHGIDDVDHHDLGGWSG